MSTTFQVQSINSSYHSPAPKHRVAPELNVSEFASTNASFELEKSMSKCEKLISFENSGEAEIFSNHSIKNLKHSVKVKEL